ncbi:hypothetical protein IH763_25335, partial [Escherichia coli]|uniref:hypothetical protein n=1 Tax=Escherichia coli TaxID=562 RepID=UPI0019DA3844
MSRPAGPGVPDDPADRVVASVAENARAIAAGRRAASCPDAARHDGPGAIRGSAAGSDIARAGSRGGHRSGVAPGSSVGRSSASSSSAVRCAS